ncbi:Putative major facilitator superfamily, MFS transporter superfamily [Septoria linicola]|uniref:Major facilitator superfamily, MFS transporter superfamily n=1 Tax=Septoria linicola TaxID=215465 RepID=A0A9Q9AY30_9PEZI|nr:putative major facilitator superfamily, MFS transporter superfamily [Septoria linicola]USW52736.1 Putative major facilitator superfamily, MFS transporter superfamily [Septoria linicola]
MATDCKPNQESAVELNENRNSLDKAKAVGQNGQHDFASRDPEWVDSTNKRLLRKIDLHLLPLLIVMYLLNFLDRSNLAQAREGTLEADLGMKGTDFNLATSIFFIGYLIMQLPSNMVITRVRPSLYLAGATTLWGVVSTCNAAVHSFTGLVVVRFMLGFVEAPLFPGSIFLMSSWYTRAELTRHVAWFYAGNALANMFGGLLAAGILRRLDSAHGIAGWRWLFIIEGVITIRLGLIAGFFLPDYPAMMRWLNDEERAFAVYRLQQDINESDETHSTSVWHGIKLALQDYRLYVSVLLQHMSLLSQTFQYFFPSMVGTLGYSSTITLLLTVAVWFATFLTSYCVTYTASKTGDRSLHIFVLILVATAGNAIATATTNIGARFMAMFLMPMGAVSAYTIIVPWVANSFPRPLVKRSASVAVANMIGNTASAYGSYMYPSSASPQYIPGGSANATISLCVGFIAIALRYMHIRENKRLERAEREAGEDLDVRGIGFRYVY